MGLFTNKDTPLKNYLYRITGYKVKQIALYKEALRHSSSNNVQKKIKITQTNERLEFLGDALLDAVVADILFRKFPLQQEGFLTEMRSRIVNRNQISGLAFKLGLFDNMDFSKEIRGNNVARKVLEGNALEALIGALYLDRGYKACFTFVSTRLIGQYLDLDQLMDTRISYKADFLKWCQKNKREVTWEHTNDEQKNRRVHTLTLIVDGENWFTEKNFSRKGAEELCCEKAIRKVENTPI